MDDEDVRLARKLVRSAASIAASWRDPWRDVAWKDGQGDPVTSADLAAEKEICSLLERFRPEDGVLAEEGTRRSGSRTWYVDPIDGTLNFLRGAHPWCSAVALEEAASAIVAAIFSPNSNEMYSANHGKGAVLNREPLLGPPPHGALKDAVIGTYMPREPDLRRTWLRVISGAATVRIGGSGTLELAHVAAGRLDAWLQANVAPWDWLPGSLIARESGAALRVIDDGAHQWFMAGSIGVVEDMTTILESER